MEQESGKLENGEIVAYFMILPLPFTEGSGRNGGNFGPRIPFRTNRRLRDISRKVVKELKDRRI
jgi:hypothetical protein